MGIIQKLFTPEVFTFVIAAACFAGLIILLAKEKSHKYNWMGWITLFASIGGLVIYGFGFYKAFRDVSENVFDAGIKAVIRAVFATFNMFLGKNEYSIISKTEIMEPPVMEFVFWLVHLAAFYVTANAILTTIGARFLKSIRKFFAIRKKKLTIIYGTGDSALQFAKTVEGKILFVDKKIGDDAIKNIEAGGWTYITEGKEKTGIGRFGHPKFIELYCLQDDESLNINYARDLLGKSRVLKLRKTGKIKNIAVTILADMATTNGEEFQRTAEKDGYDSVLITDKAYIVAKTAVSAFLPCEALTFKDDFEVVRGFSAVIVGYGSVGREVLKSLGMNGQFPGGRLKIRVFDKDYKKIDGYLKRMSPFMFNNFLQPEIEGVDLDARSEGFYDYLSANDVDCIYMCTGSNKLNGELANESVAFLRRYKKECRVFECSYDSVICHFGTENEVKVDTFTEDNLNINRVDKVAMEVNYSYLGEEDRKNKTKEEAWAELSYFLRMSNRAVADFVPTYKYLVKDRLCDLSEEKKEEIAGKLAGKLAVLEHVRWSAFYFAFGYRPMTEEEFEERASNYLKGVEGYNKKFHKDDRGAFSHSCLVPWDALKELDEKQNKVLEEKGEKARMDYQKSDADNVKLALKLIEEADRESKE